MATRLAALVALLQVVSGCSAPGSTAPQGFTIGSTNLALSSGGLERS